MDMASRVNYVVASWHGRRTMEGSYFDRYGWHAVQKNIECLSRLRQKLSQITIVAPTDPDGTVPPDYDDYLWWLREMGGVDGVPVKVIKRPNVGLSYESWRTAYLDDPTFDHYIFIEDDWCPVMDDFDSVLIDLLADRDVYLCGYMWINLRRGGCKNAAHSNGIVLGRVMGRVARMGPFKNQNHFSDCLIEAGIDIVDWQETHRSPFFHDRPSLPSMAFYAPSQKEHLIVPVQLLMLHENLRRFSWWV